MSCAPHPIPIEPPCLVLATGQGGSVRVSGALSLFRSLLPRVFGGSTLQSGALALFSGQFQSTERRWAMQIIERRTVLSVDCDLDELGIISEDGKNLGSDVILRVHVDREGKVDASIIDHVASTRVALTEDMLRRLLDRLPWILNTIDEVRGDNHCTNEKDLLL